MDYILMQIAILGSVYVAYKFYELINQFEKVSLENEVNKIEIDNLKKSLSKDEFKKNYKESICEIIDQKKKEDSIKSEGVVKKSIIPDEHYFYGIKNVKPKKTMPSNYLNEADLHIIGSEPLDAGQYGGFILNGELKIDPKITPKKKFLHQVRYDESRQITKKSIDEHFAFDQVGDIVLNEKNCTFQVLGKPKNSGAITSAEGCLVLDKSHLRDDCSLTLNITPN